MTTDMMWGEPALHWEDFLWKPCSLGERGQPVSAWD